MEDGDILELNPQSARIAGKVNAGNVYVDGLSVGDVGNVVLHDRRMLSRDGIAVVVIAVNKETGHLVGRPDIVSRGFVDTREAREMIEKSRDLSSQVLNHQKQLSDSSFVIATVRDYTGQLLLRKYPPQAHHCTCLVRYKRVLTIASLPRIFSSFMSPAAGDRIAGDPLVCRNWPRNLMFSLSRRFLRQSPDTVKRRIGRAS